MALNDIQRSLLKDCVKKTLTMAGCFDHEKRPCEALLQLAHTLPLLLLTHSKLEIRAACNNSSKENGNLCGTNAWPKVMLARINSQIHYWHHHARLLKRMPWLQNRLGLATFPKQIRLYPQFLNLHLGMILCSNYRQRHWSAQSSQ